MKTKLKNALRELDEMAADLASISGMSAEGRRALRIGEKLHLLGSKIAQLINEEPRHEKP